MSSPPILIVGAGPTGLSAAYHLGADALLVERERTVGGQCRSMAVKGFIFDQAPHVMTSNDPYVLGLYDLLLGDNVQWQDREAWVYSKSVYTRYPFQASLYGLPPEVVKECLLGAIEARYGDWRSAQERARATSSGEAVVPSLTDWVSKLAQAGASNGNGSANGSAAPLAKTPGVEPPHNLEEIIYQLWGPGIARHFSIPYNRKLWGIPLEEIDPSILAGRVPQPDLSDMLEGALSDTHQSGPSSRFGYPQHGGSQALMNGFLPHLRGPIRLNADVTRVSVRDHTVTFADGSTATYDTLISTIPLPELVRRLSDDAPLEVRNAAAGLHHVSLRCVHLGFGRPKLTYKHWIYYPEDTVFHRIFVQGNASADCNPPGGFGITCEVSYSDRKPLMFDGASLIARCINDCRRVGIIGDLVPVWAAFTTDQPYAYVIHDHEHAERVRVIRDWMAAHDIVLAGRYGEWSHHDAAQAFLAGRAAADRAHATLASHDYRVA